VALLYHRVYSSRSELGSIPMGEIHVSNLVSHLEWISRNGQVRNVEDWLKDLADPFLRGKPRVLVTFDDAYRDFFQYAAPACESQGIRPMVFVPTGFLDDRRAVPWWDVVYRAAPPSGADLDSLMGRLSEVAAANPRDASGAVREEAGRQRWSFAAWPGDNEFGRWDDLRAWKGRVDFGVHGRFHVNQTMLADAELREDLAGSRKRIEEELDHPVRALAYPYGDIREISASIQDAARTCGFEAAFCSNGPFDARASAPLALSRCVTPAHPPWSFSMHWLLAAIKSRRYAPEKVSTRQNP
jgi:peptidoglycan/xylan/chitin deacetylase (PgdA/CDA1 family)